MNDVESAGARQLQDTRTVAGDDNAIEPLRRAGVIERVRDHRPTEKIDQVFIGQPDAAGTSENNSKSLHNSNPFDPVFSRAMPFAARAAQRVLAPFSARMIGAHRADLLSPD